MRTIQELFRDALEFLRRYLVPACAVSVTSNFTGNFHLEEIQKVIEHLTLQLSNTVRWRDNMKALSQRSGTIYEIGPGRPLRDFFRTLDVTCRSITTLSSAERMFKPG
jgi:[acyl-carrier-protein] S-malonyltransferase/trans-AT polyketide synthase/acyltransferase/oxidoreductase domain-containing protein